MMIMKLFCVMWSGAQIGTAGRTIYGSKGAGGVVGKDFIAVL